MRERNGCLQDLYTDPQARVMCELEERLNAYVDEDIKHFLRLVLFPLSHMFGVQAFYGTNDAEVQGRKLSYKNILMEQKPRHIAEAVAYILNGKSKHNDYPPNPLQLLALCKHFIPEAAHRLIAKPKECLELEVTGMINRRTPEQIAHAHKVCAELQRLLCLAHGKKHTDTQA